MSTKPLSTGHFDDKSGKASTGVDGVTVATYECARERLT